MAKRVFCIGNGESRSPIDLIRLRPHGKIYGCNGLYRDFIPDVLTAVDGPMMHEVYQSGYKGELWLRDWNALPGMTYSSVVFANLTPDQIDIAKKNFKLHENEKGNKQHYVFHGSAISGQVGIIKRIEGGEQIEKKQINHLGCYVSWVDIHNDNTHTLRDLGKDRGWACGATSGWVALNQNKDAEEIYLIGHDLKSNTENINNMYKSTQNYGDEKNKPIPHVNWVNQWKELMSEFPKVKFIKVNPNGIRGDKPVNHAVPEWTNKNLEYITFDKLNETFNCI
tara:strand:- start:405 stop:1247 length:843 start_codon:yes stop_codon:yes gene_type:complete